MYKRGQAVPGIVVLSEIQHSRQVFLLLLSPLFFHLLSSLFGHGLCSLKHTGRIKWDNVGDVNCVSLLDSRIKS